jgi:micrococcal nuclease
VRSRAWKAAREWGTTAGVSRSAIPGLIPGLMLLLIAGCIEFGGPLIDHDETESDAANDEASDEASDSSSPCGPTLGTVDWVIDGDTLALVSGEHVRLILVDTTEITNDLNECWGQDARLFTVGLVEGRDITLEYDGECRDQYDRLLAYVSVDGVEVNRALLEQGQACLAYFPPNGSDRVSEYQQLESAAQQGDLGMWAACDPVPCD